ncbi:MAG TPA: alpha/beta hydrolase [Opitutus sp.]|nr:alpha/beta hydrolase [Opitutus sp.]
MPSVPRVFRSALCGILRLSGCLAPLIAADTPPGVTLDVGFHNGANFARAEFRLWLPPAVTPVRAALLLVPGSNEDGRVMVDDEAWRAFAAQHDLALVACCFSDQPHEQDFIEAYANAARGSGQALLDALQQFADRSQHPELANAPLLLWGMSAGGEFNYEFAAWRPERVIAFVVNKGGIYYSALVSPAARAVPALLFVGERDLPSRIGIIKGLFAVNRRAGALWALTPEPGVAHAEGRSRALSQLFFADVLPLRLNAPGSPLRTLDASTGLLGDPATGAITPAGRASVPDSLTAWLPTPRVAAAWRAVVTDAPSADSP